MMWQSLSNETEAKNPTLTAVVVTVATASNDQCTDLIALNDAVFFSGPLITRLIFVGNLPAGIAEEALKECFPDALRAIIPSKEKEESSEQPQQQQHGG